MDITKKHIIKSYTNGIHDVFLILYKGISGNDCVFNMMIKKGNYIMCALQYDNNKKLLMKQNVNENLKYDIGFHYDKNKIIDKIYQYILNIKPEHNDHNIVYGLIHEIKNIG